mmetsp:Transcript_23182/g.59400  ORF Transcript_23182/g.59400 Transcript_23182/m.59400 type:complete len:219 (+) Transcript_23182:32-688(+)
MYKPKTSDLVVLSWNYTSATVRMKVVKDGRGDSKADTSLRAPAPPGKRTVRFFRVGGVNNTSGLVLFALWNVKLLHGHPCGRRRLRGGELGHGLGALGHRVLGELAGKDQAHRGLDLAGGDRRLLVVAGELGRLGGDLLEEVVDEGVHDGHGLAGHAGVGVHLLEDLVDVNLVGLGLGLLGLLLAVLGQGLLGGGLVALDGRRLLSLGSHCGKLEVVR